MKNGKVFVFGIDGGTFDIILPAIRRGKLPHFRALMEEASWGILQSTVHPATPVAWSSFATGANAGKHGIFDFWRVDGKQVRLNTALDRKMGSIWTYLSQSGRDSIVLNVPFTYPPEKIKGIMIPGFDTPRVEREIFHPESIYDELIEQFGEYRLDWTYPFGKKFNPDICFAMIHRAISHRTDISLYLLQHYPWDFFMVVFSSTDQVQHLFWRYPKGREIIEDTYERLDESLGKFLALLPEDVTIIVMSDHGAGPAHGFVYLDNWLAKEGYLTWNRLNLQGALFQKCIHYLQRTLPPRSKLWLRAALSRFRKQPKYASYIDLNQTKAYSRGGYGSIYINLMGRNPWGIVEPRDYKTLCEQIARKLHELVDPKTGKRVVERVYRKEELYSGPCTEEAPDLVAQWRDYAYFTKKGIDKGEAVFSDDLEVGDLEFPFTGGHRLGGILIVKGPHVQHKHQVRASIMDMAPTALHILGEAIPSDMDGRVLHELFEEGLFQTPTAGDESPEKKIPIELKESLTLSEEDEASVRERLRNLGYLD